MDSSNMSRPSIKRRCSSPLIRPDLASLTVQDPLPVPSTKESKPSPDKVTRRSPSVADLNQEGSYQIGCHKTRHGRTDIVRCSVHEVRFILPS